MHQRRAASARSARTAASARCQRLGQHHHAGPAAERPVVDAAVAARRRNRAAATGARRPGPTRRRAASRRCARCGANSSGNRVMTSKRMAPRRSVVQAPVDRDAARRRDRPRRRRRRRTGSGVRSRRRRPASARRTRSTLCGPVSIRPATVPSATPSRLTTSQADQVDPVELVVAGGREARRAARRCARRAAPRRRCGRPRPARCATTPSPCSRASRDRAATRRMARSARPVAGGCRNQRLEENSACGSAA